MIQNRYAFLSAATLIPSLLWISGHVFTEAWNPFYQIQALKIRLVSGPRIEQTVRGAETNVAVQTLSLAVSFRYTYGWFEKGGSIPGSWEDLIRDTGSFSCPELQGTLTEVYPFLKKPCDPWGNPWVFKVKCFGNPESPNVDVELQYGSAGPDRIESRRKYGSLLEMQQDCDDVVLGRWLWRVPSAALPEGTVYESGGMKDRKEMPVMLHF